MGGRSLNSGDALRPPRHRSGWEHVGLRSRGGGQSAVPRAGTRGEDSYARGHSVALVLCSGPQAMAWRGIGAWCGMVRGKAATIVLWRVCSRTLWHVSGGVGTGLCPAGCGSDTTRVRGDQHWVVWECRGYGTGGHLCPLSVPPGESLQRGRDVGVVMLNPSKLVLCVSGVGQRGHPAWVGRTDRSCERNRAGLGWARTSCAVLCWAVLY